MNTVIWILISILLIAAVLYLLLIMPRMAGRPDTAPFKSVLYAHRGLHDNETGAPENSMTAFQKAVDMGFGIELDIQLTRDNIPVVFHDFTLKRICGYEGKLREFTYDELLQFDLLKSDEKIPKLEDVLKMVNGRVPLIIEFKTEWKDLSVCPAADKMLQTYQGPYCIESFNPLAVYWYRKNRRDILRGQLSDAFLKEGEHKGILQFVLQNLLFNCLTKPDFVAFNHKYPRTLSRCICRKLYRNMAVAYTLKTESELEAAQKYFDIYIFDSFLPGRQDMAG